MIRPYKNDFKQKSASLIRKLYRRCLGPAHFHDVRGGTAGWLILGWFMTRIAIELSQHDLLFFVYCGPMTASLCWWARLVGQQQHRKEPPFLVDFDRFGQSRSQEQKGALFSLRWSRFNSTGWLLLVVPCGTSRRQSHLVSVSDSHRHDLAWHPGKPTLSSRLSEMLNCVHLPILTLHSVYPSVSSFLLFCISCSRFARTCPRLASRSVSEAKISGHIAFPVPVSMPCRVPGLDNRLQIFRVLLREVGHDGVCCC